MFYALVLLIALPAFFLVHLWRTSFKSKLEWFLDALTSAAIILWMFLAGNWSPIGYYFRYIWLVLLIVALIVSWRKSRALPFLTKYKLNQYISIGVYAVLLLLFGIYNGFVLSSYTADEAAIDLEPPLDNGTYYVVHGGNHEQMNYHQAHPAQAYALDIVKLNRFGIRASGFYPKELERYEIFGDEVHSPCNGTVVEVDNSSPDLTPPEANPKQPSGNHVALVCENTDAVLYLAHMKKGSVTVAKGEKVTTGKVLGKVGNSGNTSEPHLHIHAEKDGKGVPVTFHGRFLVRNSLMR